MMSFKQHAATTVTLSRGSETLELSLVAPVVGWEDELERVYARPVNYVSTVGQPTKEIAMEDSCPEVLRWRGHRISLMIGKVLSEGGELEQTYPAPMPTERREVEQLADSIRAELVAANIREGDLMKLLKGYNTIQHGDLTVIAQAQAAGNASPQDAAT